MKKLFYAGIITIQFIIALGCIGAFENGTMSFGRLAIGFVVTSVITYICFKAMERKKAND